LRVGVTGLKMFIFTNSDRSWELVRPLGTEPVVRVYAETGRVEVLKELISTINSERGGNA
jgi:phosphomannomutase